MRLPMASMLEGFVSQLLADYLSNYVQGIQPEQFRLGIWNGVAQLENVELRLEAFDYLQLPFAINKGVIGKLKVQVPWKKLGWDPILISLEDVFICACPRDEFEWKTEALEARALAAKKAKLAAAELAKLSAKISQLVSDDHPSQSFLSHLSTKIIDNVQVTAQDVEFRYIDLKTDPEVAFSFGIKFTCFTMNTDHTCLGIPGTGKPKANQVNKLVEIKELGIYCNSGKNNLESYGERFDGGLSTGLRTESNWIYIVQPFDVSLRLVVNKNPLFDGSTPQYSVAIDAKKLAIFVEDRQLHEFLMLWDALSICKMREKYGRLRPAVGQPGYDRRESGWQKVWWHYAVQAVLVDVHRKVRRNSWSYLEWRMDIRRKYVALYKSKLECLRKGKPAADQNLCTLEEMEKELDLDEILTFRSIAEDQLQAQDGPHSFSEDNVSDQTDISFKDGTQEVKLDDQSSQKQRSWLNFLSLGMLGAAGSTVASGQFAGVLPDEIIEDIYEATKYQPTGLKGIADLPKGFCSVAVTSCVGGLSVTLRGSHLKEDIASVDIQDVEVRTKMWQQSVNFFITIKALEAVNLCQKDSVFRVVLGRQGSILSSFSKCGHSSVEVIPGINTQGSDSARSNSGSDAATQSASILGHPLIVLEIEFLSDDKEFDIIAKIETQSMEFVYSSKLIRCMSRFFNRPASLQTLNELIFSSLNRLQDPDIRMQSKAELVLASRKRLGLQVHMQRPVVIFPESLQTVDSTNLVVMFQSVQITSTKWPTTSFPGVVFNLQWPDFSNGEGPGCDRCPISLNKLHSDGNYKINSEGHCSGKTSSAALYNQFQLQLRGVKMILAAHAYAWQDSWKNPKEYHKLHLAESFDAEVILEICALPDEPTLTPVKILGNLPALEVFLSSRKWKMLKSFFVNHPVQENVQCESRHDNSGMHGTYDLEDKSMLSGTVEVEATKTEESSYHASYGARNLQLSIRSNTLLVKKDDSSILLGNADNAHLMFIHCDCQQELQFSVNNIHIKKVSQLLSGSSCFSLHSASQLCVIATFMPTTLWKWRWVASQTAIMLRALSQQVTVAYFQDTEIMGSARNDCFDNMKCTVLQSHICITDCFTNSHCYALEQVLSSSVHSCIMCALKKEGCNAILVCAPTVAMQPGLEITVAFETATDKHVQVSNPSVAVYLDLTAWAKVIQTLSAFMENFTSRQHADQNMSPQRIPSNSHQCTLVKDEDVKEEELSSLTSNGGSVISIPEEVATVLSGSTIFLKSSIVVLSFLVPNCGPPTSTVLKSDVHDSFACTKCLANNVQWTNLASVDYLIRCQMDKCIFVKLTLQMDNLIYSESSFSFEACILKCEVNLKHGHGEGLRTIPLLQVGDICVKGSVEQKTSPRLYVTVTVMVKKVDIELSYAILCFLRSFQLEHSEPSDSTLDFEAIITARFQRTSILLTDGRWNCNAPAFEVRIRNVDVQTSWKPESLDFYSSFELEADYHNMEKMTWEPLVESWNACFSMSRTLGSFSRFFCTNSRISSSSQLNINITKALLQVTSRVLDMLCEVSNNRNNFGSDCSNVHNTVGEAIPILYAPYWLQNDTGVSANYWLVAGPRLEDGFGGSNHNVVHPGCSIPIYIKESPEQVFRKGRVNSSSARLVDKRPFGGQHRLICVQLEGTSKASSPMSIDLVGTQFFNVIFSQTSMASDDMKNRQERQVLEGKTTDNDELDAGPNAICMPVVFEVSVQRYSKLIRIYSTVSLVNATCIPMEVRFDIPFGILPKVMEPILPGQVMPLPVHLAETGQIRWRPMGSCHLWSEAQSLSNILLPLSRLGPLRSFVSYPEHPSNAPHRCCVMVGEAMAAPTFSLSMVPEETKSNLQTHHTDVQFNFQAQRYYASGNPNLPSYGSTASILREITFQAPFVFRNCLPLPLTITIESGAGLNLSIFAPEGDSIFVFEVNTAHDLDLTISIPGFLPTFTKLGSAISLLELRKDPKEEQIVSVEILDLLPASADGSVTYPKIEKIFNLVCGAREMSIYIPLWFYNFSGVNLGIVDGDGAVKSGMGKQSREQVIPSYPAIMEENQNFMEKCSGLQTVLHFSNVDSMRLYKHDHSCGVATRRSLGVKNIISCPPCKLKSVKDERSSSESGKPKAHIYSPFKDEELSDKRIRARISIPHSRSSLDSRETRWSRPFSLNPPGGITTLVVPVPQGEGALILSVVSASALGACVGKTMTITFQPRFVLVNMCNQNLCYRQQGTDTFNLLIKGEQAHLHWSDTSRPLLVSVRFDHHGWDWSGGFEPDQLGDTQLKVRNLVTGATQMLRVEVQNASLLDNELNGITSTDDSLGTYLVLLSHDESGFMPYRIDNFSLERLRLYQMKCPNFEVILLPYSSCSYAWDEPWRPHRLVLEVPGEGLLGTYDLDAVKEYPIVQLSATDQKPERKFLVSVHAEGPARVLTFQDMNMHPTKDLCGVFPEKGLQKFEQGQERDMQCSDKFTLNFSSIGISVIDPCPQEIVFVCARGVNFQYLQGPHQQRLNLNIMYIQIDNQLHYAQYPVMLSAGEPYTSTPMAEGTEQFLDMVQYQTGVPLDISSAGAFTFMVAKWRHLASSVDCFQKIDVRIAQVQLQLDEQIVFYVFDFFRAFNELGYPLVYPVGDSYNYAGFTSTDRSSSRSQKYEFLMDNTSSNLHFIKVLKRAEVYRSWPALRAVKCVQSQNQKLLPLTRGGRKMYIETFYVAPIHVTVSFSSTSWLINHGVAAQPLLWTSAVQRRLMALFDVERAPVQLRELSLAHPLARWDAIKGIIIKHYTRQLLHEIYKVLGSAGFLGNPMGFMQSLGSGVRDFVSSPARSFVQSPSQLVGGITQGTQSLVSNTVFAVSNAATLISRAAKKGVTAFALNHDYAAEMKRHQQESGFQDSGVISELLEGLTGLLQSPVTGAERHGIPGILSGVAVGAVGLVARPVASILEVAGRTAQSIRSWSQPTQRQERRTRPPRFLRRFGPLLPYSWEEAIGNAVLAQALGSRLNNEVYVTCKPLAESGRYILLTETLLLKVTSTNPATTLGHSTRLGPEWTIDSEIALEDILHVERDGTTLNILMGSPRCLSRTKGSSKKKQVHTMGPLLHDSVEMAQIFDAEEFASAIDHFITECFKGRPRFVIF